MIAQLLSTNTIAKQYDFFKTGKTKSTTFRITQLKTLRQAIIEYEPKIFEALKADLRKPVLEVYSSEVLIVTKEIDYTIKRLKVWTKPKQAVTSWQMFPSSAKIYPEPLGVVLIIGAWNYPVQLNILPLVGAIAAGNCAIIKPSEMAPHTSGVIAELIEKHFAPEYITVVEGGVETSQQLLKEKFNHIFFTGGKAIGKIVMEAAAKHLTPVTLELGGKSPCIVDTDNDLETSARRIIWGKFFNAGQSCVAPDYLLVNKRIKENLLNTLENCLKEFYGHRPASSPDYARIINQKHYERLVKLLDGDIRIGGESNPDECYIAPTVIDNVSWEDQVMEEEIFGPILPVIEYTDISEAIALINSREKPLALYLFSNNKNLQKRVLQETSSGGVCINDTMKHFFVSSLPFGGVGESGIGSYHGKASFDTFSHYKSVLHRSFLFDLKLLYAPYEGKLPWLRRLLG
ncbi:MAG: aldehyde dehydrogenase [Rhizonema sp. NSF051]|nr:aldehyde dehydrogenase [Rhizonema sp. NSF051]